ncbi:MAG: DNA replication/repair protein RecF [bacterium]|nr:DNA replication/repair protein RecF [bacterium]
MEIKKIKLTNFRGHRNFSHHLAPLTIITGPNGIGKTNILEAILLCSTTRSHRTSYDRDLIRWDQEYARIEVELKEGKETVKIATFLTLVPVFNKNYQINGSTQKSSDIVGTLQSVLFSPETMDLVYGNPATRRHFMDVILCQNNRQYLRTLNQYNRVVRERNRLLFLINQNYAQIDELEFWDQELVKLGSLIIEKRQELSKFLNSSINNYYQSTNGANEKVKIAYKTSVLPPEFMKILQKERNKEIKYTATLFGPHRDDLLFYLNNHPLSSNASRGECRSFVLAIKLSEIDYFKSSNTSPVLLLDDVFSELDDKRRQHLTEIIQNQQTIITTAHLTDIDDKIIKKAQIITLPVKT